jgi:hypothetical protein
MHVEQVDSAAPSNTPGNSARIAGIPKLFIRTRGHVKEYDVSGCIYSGLQADQAADRVPE